MKIARACIALAAIGVSHLLRGAGAERAATVRARCWRYRRGTDNATAPLPVARDTAEHDCARACQRSTAVPCHSYTVTKGAEGGGATCEVHSCVDDAEAPAGSMHCVRAEYEWSHCDYRPVRLGATHPGNGRMSLLEMRTRQYGWGTVCGGGFDMTAATVACTQLGYGTAVAFGQWGGDLPQSHLPILVESVQCSGNVSSLHECGHAAWTVHDCGHSQDAMLQCGSTRLGVEHPTHSGMRLLEVHSGEHGGWGTVCSDGFGADEVAVVCAELNIDSDDTSVYATWGGAGGQSTLPILLDEVQCAGQENTLQQCAHANWTVHDCAHSQDVVMECRKRRYVRLTTAHTTRPGLRLLEVTADGAQWGTVCDDYFDTNNASAMVACRELGMGPPVAHGSWGGNVPQSTLPTLLDDVQCAGTESSLDDCAHIAWGSHNCGHHEDVILQCG